MVIFGGGTAYNLFENITAINNNKGVYVTSPSNQFKNSKFVQNKEFNIHSTNINTFYGNNLGSLSNISLTLTNILTSQTTTKIGNYYNEINCLANETRELNGVTYLICTNPSSYNVNGVLDTAPLAAEKYIATTPTPSIPSSESSNSKISLFHSNSLTSQILSILIVLGFLMFF